MLRTLQLPVFEWFLWLFVAIIAIVTITLPLGLPYALGFSLMIVALMGMAYITLYTLWRCWNSYCINEALSTAFRSKAQGVVDLAQQLGVINEFDEHPWLSTKLLRYACPVELGRFISSVLYIISKREQMIVDEDAALSQVISQLQEFLRHSWMYERNSYLSSFENGLRTSLHPKYAKAFRRLCSNYHSPSPESLNRQARLARFAIS